MSRDRHVYDTKLDRWMHKKGVKPAHVARESGCSQQHLLRIRAGRMEPTRRMIAALVSACRQLTHAPVKASDPFDFGEG